MRGAAAAEESLRQRDGVERIALVVERVDIADSGCCAPARASCRSDDRWRCAPGSAGSCAASRRRLSASADIDGVVDSLVRVHRIVAAVLNPGEGEDAHAHRLREQADQEGRDLERGLIHADAPVGVAVEDGGGFGEALRKLHRALLALGGEGAHVARILEEAR